MASGGAPSPAGIRHLYVHLPFCAHRCGYCDFVTLVGGAERHLAYVEALLAELELESGLLAPELETVYLGGGTPTFTESAALERLLLALPRAGEVTIEANPETVTAGLARRLAQLGVTRVSLGAQSFQPRVLETLERRAGPALVRAAFSHLREAGFDNLSLDLLYGVPGQSTEDLELDLEAALSLAPDHVSAYELEAKPGTRFTHRHGVELERQAEAMEAYFELVVDTLVEAGYRWYETSSFCREDSQAPVAGQRATSSDRTPGTRPRDLRARHNLAYWRGRDYLALGIGAVSTCDGRRWRNGPGLAGYLEALERGEPPPRELETLPESVRVRERLMLGLRLDEALALWDVEAAIDPDALGRLEALGLLERCGEGIRLTWRGRFLGGGVTVELLAEEPALPGVLCREGET